MTLQMDDNRKYTPSDWLTIQRGEFNKEADARMFFSYGDFSATLKTFKEREEPAEMPLGVKRLPENRQLGGISKGWNSKTYINVDPIRPEVRAKQSRTPSLAGSESTVRDSGGGPSVLERERPASEVDTQAFQGQGSPGFMSPSQQRQPRTPMLARTYVNAPANLGRMRESSRTPKSSSTPSLFGRTGMGVFDGCRRMPVKHSLG
eukprot:TRINITY_DN78405_c0_g1_i1.p1 TRINITY_DN78405_c0_g1~~TRINITY_DN78405_c0_g1_i1.p1  ORF type:complete len:205 (+),score=32.88 TRINITY_DN78405_c0_g1_i1:184-798(+)